MTLAANCTILGFPIVPVIIPKEDGTLSSPPGFAKCGVFVTLKNSNLVWRV
jgi:hypothetical protein